MRESIKINFPRLLSVPVRSPVSVDLVEDGHDLALGQVNVQLAVFSHINGRKFSYFFSHLVQQPGKLVHRERSVPVVVRRGELRLEVLLVLLLDLDALGSVQDRAESANPTNITTQIVDNVVQLFF